MLAYVLADLRRRGCPARLAHGGMILIDGGSSGRGSVLGFVSGGSIRVRRGSAGSRLDYDFSTLGSLRLCAGFAVIGAGLGWLALDSPALAVFGLLGPLIWLYGMNFWITSRRVPMLLERLCRSASSPGYAPCPAHAQRR